MNISSSVVNPPTTGQASQRASSKPPTWQKASLFCHTTSPSTSTSSAQRAPRLGPLSQATTASLHGPPANVPRAPGA